MKLVISAPSGYNAREIVLPLQERLTADASIKEIHVITPAAPYRQQLFPTFTEKFQFHTNPEALAGHRALLERIRPTILLTPTVGLDPRDTLILRAGKQLAIPTLTFIASWDNVFKMERLRTKGFSGGEKGRVADYEFPDFMAVWNRMNYEHLLRSFPDEVAANRLAITGPPRFDYFAHTSRIPSRPELLAYLGFDHVTSDAPLLHCATTELYPFEYIIKAIHQAIATRQLPVETLLYASVHPGGDMAKHRQYAHYGARVKYSFGRRDNSPLPEFSYLPTEEEIYYLIALWRHTTVLVNQSSTVALESMAADRPVVNVKYGQPWDWLNWHRKTVYRDFKQHYRYITEEGATTIVHTKRELIAAIAAYLKNPELRQAQRQKTLTKLISYTDGNNGQRLIEYLKQCAAS